MYETLLEAKAYSSRIARGTLREVEGVAEGSLELSPVPCPKCRLDRRHRLTIANGDLPPVRRIARGERDSCLCYYCTFTEDALRARSSNESISEADFERRLSLYRGKGISGLYILQPREQNTP